MFRAVLTCCFALVLPLLAVPETPDSIAIEVLAPLLDPVKVATLKGDRPANTRLYKVLGWLETARRAGGDVSAALDVALLHGFPHGGWCPKGRKSLEGPIPARYDLTETPSDS
jgi:hypothetical protein